MKEFLVEALESPEFNWENENLGSVFLKYLKNNGDAIFQIEADTGKMQTFNDVYWKSIRTAQHLQKKGLTSLDTVALCSQNRLESCIPLIACCYLGIKVCSLHLNLPVEDCVNILKLVNSTIIFCDEDSVDLMEKSLIGAGLENEIVVYGENGERTSFSEFIVPTNTEETFEVAKVDPNETAVIFFSSGTTGFPKGVCCTHQSLLAKLKNPDKIDASLLSNKILNPVLGYSNYMWITAVCELIGSIVKKYTFILTTTYELEHMLQILEKYKVELVNLSPTEVKHLLQFNNIKQYDLSALKKMNIIGNTFGKQEHEALRQLLPNVSIILSYGSTETNGYITVFNDVADLSMSQHKFGSVGKVYPGYTIKVVNPETNEIVGPNTEGEIRIKGKSMFKEYLKDPVATKEAFDEEGYFKTGDIGYYDDDKCFYIVDRIKEIIKYFRWHLMPTELQTILLMHPGIKEAAVIGIPHEQDGERPMACVVLHPGYQITEDEILTFFNDQVSDRKQLRAGVKILDKLPYTLTGKLKRKELLQQILESK